MIRKGEKLIKKIMIAIFLALLLPQAFAQTVTPVYPSPADQLPTCDQNFLTTRITQEHQLTRKFMIDTYNEKSQLFFQEADKRMTYLEKEYERELHNAVFTLGFLWLFSTILVSAIFGILRLWLQGRQHKKLKKDIAAETIKLIKDEVDKGSKINVIKERPSITIQDHIPTPPPMQARESSGSSIEDVYEKLKRAV